MTYLFLISVCLTVLLVVGSSLGSAAADPLVLVQDGQAKAAIVLARKPGIATQLAARELQHYIKKITRSRQKSPERSFWSARAMPPRHWG